MSLEGELQILENSITAYHQQHLLSTILYARQFKNEI